MTAGSLLAILVLVPGIAVVLLCCAALLVVRDAFARLHCASLASVAGPLAVAIAIVLHDPSAQTGVRALAFALIALAGAAVSSHALARALRARENEKAPRR